MVLCGTRRCIVVLLYKLVAVGVISDSKMGYYFRLVEMLKWRIQYKLVLFVGVVDVWVREQEVADSEVSLDLELNGLGYFGQILKCKCLGKEILFGDLLYMGADLALVVWVLFGTLVFLFEKL